MLSEALPIYSGGLGNVAGDQLKTASDLGVPVVAIFTGSRPGLTAPVGSGPIAVLGADGAPPAVDAVVDAVEKVAR